MKRGVLAAAALVLGAAMSNDNCKTDHSAPPPGPSVQTPLKTEVSQPVKDLLDALSAHPYAQPVMTPDPEQGDGLDAWLRLTASAAPDAWLIATDRNSGQPVWWQAIPNGRVVRGEQAHVSATVEQDATLVDIPQFPTADPEIYLRAGSSQPWTVSTTSTGPGSPSKSARLHEVRKATSSDPAIDVVFLSSRVQSSELPNYRNAVECIANGMVHDPAFAALAPRINVWRLDLASTGDLATAPATVQCAVAPGLASTPYAGDAALPDVLGQDVRIAPPDPAVPTVLWFGDFAHEAKPVLLGAKAILGHKPRLVVALVNDTGLGGGGLRDGGLAVATLHQIDLNGWDLVSHELGHALGLYDEAWNCATPLNYVGGGPNIMEATAATLAQPDPAWETQCSTPGCQQYPKGSGCQLDMPGANFAPGKVGVYVGANCSCDFASGAEACRMRTWDSPAFCEVCKTYLGVAAAAKTFASPLKPKSTPGGYVTLMADAADAGRSLSIPTGSFAASGYWVAEISLGGVPAQVLVQEVDVLGRDVAGRDVVGSLDKTKRDGVARSFRVARSGGEPGQAGKQARPLEVVDAVTGTRWAPTRVALPTAH